MEKCKLSSFTNDVLTYIWTVDLYRLINWYYWIVFMVLEKFYTMFHLTCSNISRIVFFRGFQCFISYCTRIKVSISNPQQCSQLFDY